MNRLRARIQEGSTGSSIERLTRNGNNYDEYQGQGQPVADLSNEDVDEQDLHTQSTHRTSVGRATVKKRPMLAAV